MKDNLSKRPLLAIFCIWALLTLNSCIQISYTYGVVGNPAISADGKYAVVLVAESKAVSKQENGGYWSTGYKSSYWLKLYETATGKFIKKKKIISSAEQSNMLPICYGGYGDRIWLHTNGLKAYDISSLDEIVNEEKLAMENSFSTVNFPDDQRSIYEMVADGYIRFTARDGNKYRLDLGILKIKNEKEFPLSATEKLNEQLHQQMSLRITYGVRCDTMNNKMWILAKDSATAIDTNPNNTDNEYSYKLLSLFTADYTISATANHQFYRTSNFKKLKGTSYPNGIFLKDFSTNKVVRLQKNGAYIVLHNDSLGDNSKALLTAIDESNNASWQVNTGLNSRIGNCIVKGNYCVLAGNKEYLLSPHVGNDMICVINTETGKMQKLSIKE